jgi:hypothetical protein
MGKGTGPVLDSVSDCRSRVSDVEAKLRRELMHDGRATAKYWLYFLKGFPSRDKPEPPIRAVEKYVVSILPILACNNHMPSIVSQKSHLKN